MIEQVRNITDGSVVTPLWHCDFDPTTGDGVGGADPFMLLVRTDVPSLYRKTNDSDPNGWELIGTAESFGGVAVEQGGGPAGEFQTLDFTPSSNWTVTDAGGGRATIGLKVVTDGSTITGDGTAGAPLVSLGGGSTALINVKTYGATGNGVTNDHDAIMSAIAAAKSASLPVFFPAGTYFLASSLVLTAGLSAVSFVGGGVNTLTCDTTVVTGFPVFTMEDGCHDIDFTNVGFTGSNDYSKDTNVYAGVEMHQGSTDLRFHKCTFYQITPMQAYNSYVSTRLTMQGCFIHNAPSGVHPPSDTKIDNCFFICDTYVPARGQAIYAYGGFNNIQITNCTFKNISREAIQIRGVTAYWTQKQNFRIIGNSFENCPLYAVWIGSDAYPNVTQLVVEGNTFLNCVGPIFMQGQGSASVVGNVVHYSWEFPFSLPLPANSGITTTTGVGLAGHYGIARGINIVGNKLAILQPYFGKIELVTKPVDGDTFTVGSFVYTWRNVPAALNDVEILPALKDCTDRLADALRGLGDQITAPNNVLRSSLDAITDYEGPNPNIVVIASFNTFNIAVSGAYATVTTVVDLRTACPNPILARYCIGVHIADNISDDFANGIVVDSCRGGEVYDNHNTNQNGIAVSIAATYNVDMRYRGNRCLGLNFLTQGSPAYNRYFDGFSVIDDDFPLLQEGTIGELMGRSGVVPIGDRRAFAWFWYGREEPSTTPSSDMFHYRDGDQLKLVFGGTNTFTFKRSSPGAGEFNSPDTLLALLNAISGITATFPTFTNRFGTPNPKVWIKITATTQGTAGNAGRLYFYRYKWPGDTTIYLPVQQPLINGYILRNSSDAEEFTAMQGGSAALDTTFVFTPIANPQRGVEVWGADAASVALAPRVYSADIIPGVGFKITHGAGAGTESFHYRVNNQ